MLVAVFLRRLHSWLGDNLVWRKLRPVHIAAGMDVMEIMQVGIDIEGKARAW
jgi:hypothetical protein